MPASRESDDPLYPLPDPVAFSANLMRLAGRVPVAAALMAQGHDTDGPADPLDIRGTLLRAFLRYATDPRRVMDSQASLLTSHLSLWMASGRRLAGYPPEDAVARPETDDRRFRNPEWSENPFFDFLKQSYLLTQNWMEEQLAHGDPDDPDLHERKKAAFYVRQVFNALSPGNFAPTNPEVLSETLNSNGDNLVRGMENFIADLKRGGGRLAISQTDMDAFSIGENIATTPGKVIFRNPMMELIQYAPATTQVFRKPLLIVPPWINKFYILDLNEEKSFIRWAVGKGHTVFVISWVNPDEKTASATFSDYMNDGLLAALDAVRRATGENSVNAIGYCIGGTLLGATLARMSAEGDSRIASATFFAAQMDFSEAGDLSIFIDDRQLDALEERMQADGGYLAGRSMAQTFNMLRSNDLIWGYVINNYLMGKPPPSFDLLYWNADSTRMPANMHLFYLRECYLHNKLARGKMVLDGVRLDLSAVKIPVYLQSSREDHIAPCGSVYKAVKLFGGPVHFIVAGSGHIAGVINPPDAGRYQFWTNGKTPESLPESLDDWFAGAAEHPGSWWPDWQKWIARRGGGKVAARIPGDGELAAMDDAPGGYVRVRE